MEQYQCKLPRENQRKIRASDDRHKKSTGIWHSRLFFMLEEHVQRTEWCTVRAGAKHQCTAYYSNGQVLTRLDLKLIIRWPCARNDPNEVCYNGYSGVQKKCTSSARTKDTNGVQIVFIFEIANRQQLVWDRWTHLYLISWIIGGCAITTYKKTSKPIWS